ncbi:MAG: hypothetical protein Q7T32_08120 [Moraxellaceae bacterium]|nr:hypothetical protein [Moraxellaceae bacterium]
MLDPRTLKVLFILVAGYMALLLPGAVWPAYLDSPVGILAVIPFLSVYLFHNIGIPGLLEHNGLCGWGWCAPTLFGWVFIVLFWLLVAWLLAWLVAHVLMARKSSDKA